MRSIRRGHWLGGAALAVAAAVSVAVVVVISARGSEGDGSSARELSVVSAAGAVDLGDFVWPAPARGYETLDDLATAFAAEVLERPAGVRWEAEDLSEATSLTFTGPELEITGVAVEGDGGWGFVQLGYGFMVEQVGEELSWLMYGPPYDGVVGADVEVRYRDGTVSSATDEDFTVELPVDRDRVASALLVFRDGGAVVGVIGRRFTEGEPETVALPTTTTIAPPLTLYVSNQSFDVPEVAVRVTVDDRVVLDEVVPVLDQHHLVVVPLDLAPGRHTIAATAGGDVELFETFELPEAEPRWAYLSYWTIEGPPLLSLDVYDEKPQFG